MLRAFRNIVIFYACVALFVVLLSSCTFVHFECGNGEFGARAEVTAWDLDTELVQDLSRFCGEESDVA